MAVRLVAAVLAVVIAIAAPALWDARAVGAAVKLLPTAVTGREQRCKPISRQVKTVASTGPLRMQPINDRRDRTARSPCKP